LLIEGQHGKLEYLKEYLDKKNPADINEVFSNLIGTIFRSPGGSIIGFSNLADRGSDGEKLSSPYRTFQSIPSLKSGKFTSAHSGRERTPKCNNGNELITRIHFLCMLANSRTKQDAYSIICNFEYESSTRSRILIPSSKKSTATQGNDLDSLINASRRECFAKNKLKNVPECALSKFLPIISLKQDNVIPLFRNELDTNTPPTISIFDFIKETDGVDRSEFQSLCKEEYPYLTKKNIDTILEYYSSNFPKTITQEIVEKLRIACNYL